MKLKVFIGFITIFLILGCPNDSSSTPELLITAEVSPSSVSGYDATVALVIDSTAVSGATVTINGTTVPETSTAGAYLVNLSTATTGDTLSFSATKDGYTASASAIIPPLVVTTSPTDYDPSAATNDGIPPVKFASDVLVATNPITLEWNQLTGADAVDEIEIFIDKLSTAGQTTDYSATVLGSATSYTIPANTFEALNTTTKLEIRTIRKSVLTGVNINSSSEFKALNTLEISFGTTQ